MTGIWDASDVSQRDWDNLTHIEQCFLINAIEHDLLPGVLGDLDVAEHELTLAELTITLLQLVDRGWIEARRYAHWIAPDGRMGLTPGELVPRERLPQVLADPANWDYPDDPSWIGALTLVATEAGLAISRRTPQEIEELGAT